MFLLVFKCLVFIKIPKNFNKKNITYEKSNKTIDSVGTKIKLAT